MNRHILTLEQPAIRWEDALPSGNGRIGAMVYGNIHRETVLVNHEALWLPLWEKPTLPDMARHLPHYRRLFEQLKFEEADRFWREKLDEAGWPECIYTNPSHPAFDLKIEQRIDEAFEDYQRRLDFRSGEVTVAWTAGGVDFERKLFVSRADNVIVMKITSNRKGMVDIKAELLKHPLLQNNFKTLHYPRSFAPEEIPLSTETSAASEWLRFEGRYPNKPGYIGQARVIHRGGFLRTSDNMVTVGGADEVLIIMTVDLFGSETATVQRPTSNVQEETLQRGFEGLDSRITETRNQDSRLCVLTADYATLLERHRQLHEELYARVELDLDVGSESEETNEELLVKAYRKRAPNALIEKLFHYGRYLFISSTHDDGWPPHLQGIWNGDYIPAWSGDYTLDENIQMHHWAVMPGGLPELMNPYFNYLDSSISDWRANARALFGCRGVMTCLRQSDHGLMVENMPYMIWIAGAGWLGQAYYDYFLYTGDLEFLRDRAVPFLKEVALFFEDFLYEGSDGKYIISPSMSPENIPDIPGGTRPSLNATMDIFVIREALGNLCRGCRLLDIEADGVARWEAIIEKLPDIEINDDGAIREWQHPALKDNYHHRHLSHIYGLFPGFEISEERTPELFDACRVAVEKRLVVGILSQTGWSLAHQSNVYARLGLGDRAWECLNLLTRSCVWPNFLTCHDDVRQQGITMGKIDYKQSVFQVDANMGLTAAVLEMLVFSVPGQIKLLPALPEGWPRGSVKGICCRGGIVLAIAWDRTLGQIELTLESRTAQTVELKFPAWVDTTELSSDGVRLVPSAHGCARSTIALPSVKQITKSS